MNGAVVSVAVTMQKGDCAVGQVFYCGYISILLLALEFSTVIALNACAHSLKLFIDFYIFATYVCQLRLFLLLLVSSTNVLSIFMW
jgi:hypothetical protein